MNGNLKIVAALCAIGFALPTEAKVREKVTVVSCYTPGSNSAPADYLSGTNNVYNHFRTVDYDLYSGRVVPSFGIDVVFQEPAFLATQLAKLDKGYQKRLAKYQELTSEGGMALKPEDPARGTKEYSFFLTVSGTVQCANLGGWLLKVRVLRDGKWEIHDPKTLELLRPAPDCSTGGGGSLLFGGPSCTHKGILYTGIPWDSSIQAIGVDGLDCKQVTRRLIFVMKYDKSPAMVEVPRQDGRGTTKTVKWPEESVPSTLQTGEVLDQDSE